VLVEEPRFPDAGVFEVPGSLLAPMPGTVVRINVEPGQLVKSGSVVVVLEAMKMEQTVVAPHDGRVVEVGVRLHQAVDVGTVLAIVEEDE
jgi:biotin carboxyl carrier protein